MPKFKYSAKDSNGAIIKNNIEGNNYADVYTILQNLKLTPIKITEVKTSNKSEKTKKMKLKEVTIFCRQFSTMLSSGLTLIRIFEILKNQCNGPKFKHLNTLYSNIHSSIQRGNSLYESMSAQENIFPPLLLSMVHSGEASGTLDDVMTKMAAYFEKQNKLMGKVKTGMAYPIILASVCVLVIVFLFIGVLPEFFNLFNDLGVELPWITKVAMDISDFFQTKWMYIILFGLLIFAILKVLKSSEKFNAKVDQLLLKLPIIKVVIEKVSVARFTGTMGVLYSSGISMIESIGISSNILTNRIYQCAFGKILKGIEQGKMLSHCLQEEDIFESMVSEMLYVGEETGSLDSVLNNMSDFYSDEADEAISRAVAILEPVMIIFMGIIILFIVAAIIIPTFELSAGMGDV